MMYNPIYATTDAIREKKHKVCVLRCVVQTMLGVTLSALTCLAIHAADRGINEIQFQYGNHATPTFAGDGDAETMVLTFQHASAWQYGTNYYFIDFLSDYKEDGFNDEDFYGEWYPTLSIPKILGQEDFRFGWIRDVRIIAGLIMVLMPRCANTCRASNSAGNSPALPF